MVALIPVAILSCASIAMADYLKKSGAITYLILLMASLNVLYLAALVDMIRPAAALIFVLLLGFSIFYFLKKGKKKTLEAVKKNVDIYMALNWISSILFAVTFTLQQPRLYYWDELVFWGPSAKYLKLTHHLHTVGINPYQKYSNYPAGNAVIHYFFSFFTSEFVEHILLLSYALVYFAVFSMIARVIYEKTKNYMAAIASYFVLFLTPFMSRTHAPLPDYSSLSYAYGTAMADFNIAVLFAAVIGLYLADRKKPWFLLPLVYLATIKRAGIFFVLLAVCVIVCFEFFSAGKIPEKIKKGCVALLTLLLIPLACVGIFGLSLRTNLQPQESLLSDSAQETELQSELPDTLEEKNTDTPLCIVFPHLGNDKYHKALWDMTDHFQHNHETIFGRDAVLIAGLLLLGLLAAKGAKRENRLGVLAVNIGLTAGCFVYSRIVAYQIHLWSGEMVEYPRYMQSYYFAWMMTVFVLVMAAPHTKALVKQIVLCGILVVTMGSIAKAGLTYTALDAPQNAYADALRIEQTLKPIKEVLDEDDSVYLVYKDLDELTFIRHQYNFLPNNVSVDEKQIGLDFSIGFREEIDENSELQHYNIAAPYYFEEVMHAGFDYVYVVEADKEFKDSYGSLFSDGLTDGKLYKVTYEDVPMQEITECTKK